MKDDENKWNELYTEYIKDGFKSWNEYFEIKMKLKKRFCNMVKKYAKNGKPILECGAGTGKFSAYLASMGYTAYAMDIEPAMVAQAKELSNRITPFNPVIVIQCDIRSIPYGNKFFSVAHSSGVFEHYSNKEIVTIINEQLRVADTIVFSVPSPYFEEKMFGNERFMMKKEWRAIIAKSNAKIVEETGYHYKPFRKRFVDIIKKPQKLFSPIAMYTFVLKEKLA